MFAYEVSTMVELSMGVALSLAGLWPWVRPRLSQALVHLATKLLRTTCQLAVSLAAVVLLARVGLSYLKLLVHPARELRMAVTESVAALQPSPMMCIALSQVFWVLIFTFVLTKRGWYRAESVPGGDNDRMASTEYKSAQRKKVKFGAVADDKAVYRAMFFDLKNELKEIIGQAVAGVQKDITHVWEQHQKLLQRVDEVVSAQKVDLPEAAGGNAGNKLQVSAALPRLFAQGEDDEKEGGDEELVEQVRRVVDDVQSIAANTRAFQREVAEQFELQQLRLAMAEEMLEDNVEMQEYVIAAAGAAGDEDSDMSVDVASEGSRQTGNQIPKRPKQVAATSSKAPASPSNPVPKTPEQIRAHIERVIAQYADPNVPLRLPALARLSEKDLENLIKERRRRRPRPLRNPYLTPEEKEVARTSLAKLGELWRQYACREKNREFIAQAWDKWDLGVLTEEECDLPRNEVKYILNTRRSSKIAEKAADSGKQLFYCEVCETFKTSPHRCAKTGWTKSTKRPGVTEQVLFQQQGKGAIRLKPTLMTDAEALQKEMQHLKVVQQENAKRRQLAQELAERPSVAKTLEEAKMTDASTSNFQ